MWCNCCSNDVLEWIEPNPLILWHSDIAHKDKKYMKHVRKNLWFFLCDHFNIFSLFFVKKRKKTGRNIHGCRGHFYTQIFAQEESQLIINLNQKNTLVNLPFRSLSPYQWRTDDMVVYKPKLNGRRKISNLW